MPGGAPGWLGSKLQVQGVGVGQGPGGARRQSILCQPSRPHIFAAYQPPCLCPFPVPLLCPSPKKTGPQSNPHPHPPSFLSAVLTLNVL